MEATHRPKTEMQTTTTSIKNNEMKRDEKEIMNWKEDLPEETGRSRAKRRSNPLNADACHEKNKQR